MRTYLLFEIANSHGGSKDYVYKLIDALPQGKNTRLRQGFGGQAGIKFQVFKYDQLALKDYEWYKVYVKLFFDKASWKKILLYTKGKGFDIWIDVFDLYSVEVLKDNLNLVTGIKLQSSVLDNLKVLEGLARTIEDKKIKIVLNIAGREIDNIKETSADLKSSYFPTSEI